MEEKDKRRVVALSIREDMLQKVDALAEAAGLSRSRFIELMIRNEREVEQHE